MLIAIIPARGGSKGIPKKNLRLISGKPMIQYTIESAMQCKSIDQILLSTDDDEIAEFGEHMGLKVNYRRPIELAADATSMFETLEHALKWFERDKGFLPENTLLLQPTSPLRALKDIEGCINEFNSKALESLVSVHRMSEHPYECIANIGATSQYLVQPPIRVFRRQDYEANFFYINGSIYLAKSKFLLENQGFVEIGKTYFFEIPRSRGLDIDTYLDLAIAEALISAARN